MERYDVWLSLGLSERVEGWARFTDDSGEEKYRSSSSVVTRGDLYLFGRRMGAGLWTSQPYRGRKARSGGVPQGAR